MWEVFSSVVFSVYKYGQVLHLDAVRYVFSWLKPKAQVSFSH